jgi:hypothetical protein
MKNHSSSVATALISKLEIIIFEEVVHEDDELAHAGGHSDEWFFTQPRDLLGGVKFIISPQQIQSVWLRESTITVQAPCRQTDSQPSGFEFDADEKKHPVHVGGGAISFRFRTKQAENQRKITKEQNGLGTSLAGSGGVNWRNFMRFWPCLVTAVFLLVSIAPAHAGDTNLEEQVQLLRDQNAMLQQQLQKQNQSLDALTQKVQGLEAANTEQESATLENSAPAKSGFNLGMVDLSGEGGIALFKTGSEGFAPNSEFRVDEARLFIETPIWKEVYFYSEVDLATRENPDAQVYLGELYLDFEDVSQLWGQDDQLNARVGRMYIPFGEEYLTRYAIDNPLILHSVSDFWGVDSGVEIYGALGKFSYVAAVQNGGDDGAQYYNDDKSVAGRISFDPNRHWHFSVSGMRTGDVNAQNYGTSAEWFGNGFFQSIGSPATTAFHVNAVELDMTAHWASGYVQAFGGYAQYGDNDPTADNRRDIYFYSAEVVQNLPEKFYAAARFSEVIADKGIPIVGNGDFSDYFSALTADLWRLSLGIGYRFSDRMILKTEYAFEGGRLVDGESRDQENFFGTEVAFQF